MMSLAKAEEWGERIALGVYYTEDQKQMRVFLELHESASKARFR
jgi:hypothetical protein